MEQPVETLASSFIHKYNVLFEHYPKYRLDLTWPTVGVLDLISYNLRGKKTLSSAEDGLLLACSAYIAIIAYEIWSCFHEDLKAELVFAERPRPSIKIEGKGGPLLPEGQLVFVNITETLRDLFADTPSPLPYFEHSSRVITPGRNLLSVIAPGIFCGATPFARGSDHVGYLRESVWAKRSDAEMQINIRIAAGLLAGNTASYYQRNFPSEEQGQDGRLFAEASLIFPPAGHREAFPAVHAATGLARYIKEHRIPLEGAAVLAENLALMPDELISSAGFAVSCALAGTGPIKPGLFQLGYALGPDKALLRPAVLLARQMLGLPADFCKLAATGRFQEALKLIRLDHRLGLTPLLRLPYEYLQHTALIPIYNALALGQREEALEFFESIIAGGKANIEFVLQQAHLYLLSGDLENAEGALRLAEKGLPGTDPENQTLFLEIAAGFELGKGDADRAIPLLDRCLELADPLSPTFRSAAHMLCWALATKGYLEQAEARATQLLERVPQLVEVRATRLALLEQLDMQRWEDEVRTLARIAPTSRPVFDAVLALEQGRRAP